MEQQNDIKMGRFISLVLRHNPSAAGISLDENGWADVDALIHGVRQTGRFLDLKMLERIVAENNKKRYSFNADHTKIRANQGHSIAVDVELKAQKPPAVLYHGTAAQHVDSIRKQGIAKRNRQHVHLSVDLATARNVGRRHGNPVILKVDSAAMAADGFTFWLSENGVWLCEEVPPQYLS